MHKVAKTATQNNGVRRHTGLTRTGLILTWRRTPLCCVAVLATLCIKGVKHHQSAAVSDAIDGAAGATATHYY